MRAVSSIVTNYSHPRVEPSSHFPRYDGPCRIHRFLQGIDPNGLLSRVDQIHADFPLHFERVAVIFYGFLIDVDARSVGFRRPQDRRKSFGEQTQLKFQL